MSQPTAESAGMTEGDFVQASLFEGLFDRGLRPQGEFAAELKRAGYDPKRFQPRYAVQVWRDCLEVARRHAYPEVSSDEGYRAIGARLMEGFFHTVIGQISKVALPLMGAEGMIERLPKLLKTGHQFELIRPVKEAPGRWRVTFQDRNLPHPFLMAGMIENALKRQRASTAIHVENATPGSFELIISL